MEEIWKDIKEYEGLYQVSNLGNIKSLRKLRNGTNVILKEKLLKPGRLKYGHLSVVLTKNRITKTFRVHRLVAEAFIPNPNNYPVINHKDENPSNNAITNLEWCTIKYNTNYGTAIQRRTESKSIPINQYDLQGTFIKRWKSAKEIEDTLNYAHGSICKCCRNKLKKFKGFIWRYA